MKVKFWKYVGVSELLGTDIDRKVAWKINQRYPGLNVTRYMVAGRRRLLGIPRADVEAWWEDEDIRGRLGKVPDIHIGRELGISRTAVAKRRKMLGIPSPGWTAVSRVWAKKEKKEKK